MTNEANQGEVDVRTLRDSDGHLFGEDAAVSGFMLNSEIGPTLIEFQLTFERLRQHLQLEQREFQAIANIIKARHDTAKNLLNNLNV